MRKKENVCALVFADGLEREKNETCEKPCVSLLKILDTTVLEHILSSLNNAEISHVFVLSKSQVEQVKSVCEKVLPSAKIGKDTSLFSFEDYENTIIISGDVFSLTDFKELFNFHVKEQNDVTVFVPRKENPTLFQAVYTDKSENITKMKRNPSWSEVKSGKVNGKVFVLSQNELDAFLKKEKTGYLDDYFSLLLKTGKKVMAFYGGEYWFDIGIFQEFRKAQAISIMKNVGKNENVAYDISYLQNCGIHAKDPCYVSQSVVIGKNVKISDTSVICKNAHIGDDCDIIGSVIGTGSKIGNGTVIMDSVIGENCAVGENCIIDSGCNIGNGCKIEKFSLVKKDTVLKEKSIYSKENERKMSDIQKKLIFLGDGKVCFKCEDFKKNSFFFAKSVISAYKMNESHTLRVGVMAFESCDTEKNDFIFSLLKENVKVFDMGFGNDAIFRFSPCVVGADFYAFFERSNESCYVTLLNEKGEEISQEDERKISKIHSLLCDKEAFDEDFFDKGNNCERSARSIYSVPVFELYKSAMCRLFRTCLCGLDSKRICVLIKSGEYCFGNTSAFYEVLCDMGATVNVNTKKGIICAEISSDGKELKITQSAKEYDNNHVLAIILNNLEVLGISEICGEKNMPSVLKNVCECKINTKKERLSLIDNIFSDGAVRAILLLCILNLSGCELSELYEKIPKFDIYCDEYIANSNRAMTMEHLSRLYTDSTSSEDDGITLKLSLGNVTVIPNRARGFKIISEAMNSEIAKELCIKIEKAIREE